MATTPKTSLLTKLYYADSKTTGTRSQVIYVQEIPVLEEPAEAVTYNALDLDGERQEKTFKPIPVVTIPILFTEAQHDELKAIADANTEKYWFVRYPDSTATTTGKPLVKTFVGTCDLSGDAITMGDMIQENLTLYRSSDITESKDFPSA